MSESSAHPTPTEIQLHQKSRRLSVAFSDGCRFECPCEYLRVSSKAAEVRAMSEPVTGKEGGKFTSIEPQGQYALGLSFDDGQDTGIYSCDSLITELGVNQEENWRAYLDRLGAMGYSRQVPEAERASANRRCPRRRLRIYPIKISPNQRAVDRSMLSARYSNPRTSLRLMSSPLR